MTSQQGLPPRHNGLSAWTTRRWLRVGVSVALAVLAALGAVGLWTTIRTSDITDELVNTRSPSLTYAVRLEAALVNQETGIRGYGLTGRSDFLDPYRQGVTDQKTAVDRLRELLVDNAQGREDLQQVLDRTQVWQQRIALPIAASPAGAPAALAAERAEEGRNSFDRVRAALAAQQEHVRTARSNAVKNLDRATQLRNWVFIAIAGVIVLVAALVFEGLRRGITDPLTRLGSDARQVARGNFAHPVATTGPADLRQLGADMEAMRRRLVDELAFSEQARHQLDERAADLKRSNAELEQFAYVASHDLQEPLRKVSSFTQLLQRRYADQLDERADQYIAFAVDGANRMQTLINDLLTFSRVGRVHNEHRLVELEPLVEDTLSTLSISIEESGATISHDALPAVVGDTTQLGMLWQNLISNAIKFRHPHRRPEIHIGALREGDLWRFTVTDNGIGIDPEFADRVFIIFQRLHTKDAYPGSGIGLAMCKKIVEFHGGTIAVDTHHSPGTRISFTLLADDNSPTDAEDPRS